MSLTITDPDGLMNPELERWAERRFRFALSRFDDRISRIDISVSIEPTADGVQQTACRVRVSLRRADDVEVTDRDTDIASCISRAAQRAGRTVLRLVEFATYPRRAGGLARDGGRLDDCRSDGRYGTPF
jgi:hypothetical protein